ncbi:MAG: hypothetical protein U0572_09360 [Phycisphaerales bacterium]
MSRLRTVVAIVCGLAAALGGATGFGAVVELRGAQPPINAERVSIEPEGVRVTRVGGVSSMIAWDMVRSVSGAEAAKDLAPMMEVADDLWRARSRVQRGDLAAARPLFEKHFDRFRGTTSETALIVAEGVLRCRLASNDWLQAIVPAIETARLRRAGVATDRFAALSPVLDDATLLAPQLAPDWTPDDRTRAVADELAALSISDAIVARLAALYSDLLRGVPPKEDARKDDAAGVAFLHAIARLQSGDEAVRARAAKDLAAATKPLPDWARAWANHAIGRAEVASDDRARKIDGVLALLRVAAQPTSPPRLVRSSLDLAIPALKQLGDAEGAAALERERQRLGGRRASAPSTTPARSPASAPTSTTGTP